MKKLHWLGDEIYLIKKLNEFKTLLLLSKWLHLHAIYH